MLFRSITVTLCLAGTYSMASAMMSTSAGIGNFQPGADDILSGDDAEMELGEDTDGDGLPDRMERTQYGTDPLDWDTDGDGMSDGYEVENGLNPLDSGDAGLEDIIIDTVTDGGADTQDAGDTWPDPDNGPLGDPDGDGLVNIEEMELGTDPRRNDTDGDGLDDPDELNTHGTDPTSADTDGDLLEDGVEVTVTDTNPLLADTDGNGTSDGDEDPDKDRYTNLQEVDILLTDPLDGTSKFTFEFVRTATEHSITFTAMRGRRYKVERSIDLNEWSEVISFVGSGSAVTVPLGPPFSQRWFYRVVVSLD